MQLTDIHVIKKANDWLSQKKPIWLCTILNTYGSAPRPIGSIFVTDGEKRYGSISGGCLEDVFVEMIAQGQFQLPSQTFIYGKHGTEQNIVRELPCGGTIKLLVEKLLPSAENKSHIQQWLSFAEAQQPFYREVFLDEELRTISPIGQQATEQIITTEQSITLAYAQIYRLLLIGIGQVTEHVAQLGLLAGFDVKVCDMRKELASSWRFNKANGGVDVIWMSPDLFIDKYVNHRSAVLALAHDPRIDDVALMNVFASEAFYIGAMGSQRTTDTRNERLQRICELSEQQLSRLHAPIGLNIGSKTPVEIAISTLADIIRVRHQINKEQL
ncbi:xanthine dehydrogenase [Thalassotalea sp. 42_200_T64]|nr:xanthine dehydrogenase [Thalassotalea sp. 42_200_T64]